MIKKFGANDDVRKYAKRYYFLIDENGKIIWRSVTGTLLPVDKLLTDLGEVLKSAK